MRDKREFAQLFPSTAREFWAAPPTASEYLAAIKDNRSSRIMHVWLLADDLLAKCASYREQENLFARIQFANKRNLLSEEIGIVAKKQEQTTQSNNGRAEWKGFLDFRLDSDQLERLDAWHPKPAEIWAMVEHTIQQGYRLTLSYNKHTKMATCTIIDDDAKSPTGGYALSSGDTDGALALKMAVFKQHVLLDNEWNGLLGSAPPQRRG